MKLGFSEAEAKNKTPVEVSLIFDAAKEFYKTPDSGGGTTYDVAGSEDD